VVKRLERQLAHDTWYPNRRSLPHTSSPQGAKDHLSSAQGPVAMSLAPKGLRVPKHVAGAGCYTSKPQRAKDHLSSAQEPIAIPLAANGLRVPKYDPGADRYTSSPPRTGRYTPSPEGAKGPVAIPLVPNELRVI